MNISTQSKVTRLLVIVAVLAIASFAIVALVPTAQAATFGVNLKQGSTGADVMELQKALNTNAATQVSVSGAGSPGSETSYFGAKTKAAVIKYQELYASEILAPNGLTKGTGFVGPSTRAKLSGGSTTTTTTTTVVPGCTSTAGYSPTTGQKCDSTTTTTTVGAGALSVSAGAQPGNSLAPESAARVPFTTFTVTAGAGASVDLNSVTIERAGLAANAVFSGIVLLDQNNVQLGTVKTLNSNNQAIIGEKVTIPAGQTRTFTVAGNMAADNDARSGQVVSLSVIAVNTSVAVSGSLPITGASHTVNSTLVIGKATFNVSSFDPNSAQTKEIGTTAVRLAGIRVTAGSAENIRLKNIRWNNTGSAGSGDIAGVVTIVGSTEYPTTVSADGKFYTANFGSGVVLDKGNNTDIYVKSDIIGGPDRTVIFDIDKDTDIYVTGETFGYGITGTAGATGAESASTATFSTDGSPFFDAAHLTISAGSATTIQKSATVPAQNIAVNVSNQALGAFETDIKGEAINIAGITLTVASTTGSGTGLLTSVTIADQNGKIVTGPVDATYTSALVQTVTFTDSMTIPVGKMVYTVKGKVASDIGNGGTYIVTVTPSGWTSPKGNTTGNTITISQGAFTLNTMTVRAAALAISVSANPVAQNITAGTQGFNFANYQLNATQSGEDVRFSSMALKLTFTTMVVTEVTACQLFDGATALNTGTNVVNPTGASAADKTFTFDTTLTIPKGTVKTLALKCNISSDVSAADSLQWGIANTAANITVTGVTSSNSVTETVTASDGQLMTVAAGALVASKDSASPSYLVVKAGSVGVVNGIINFRATNENVTLQRIGLSLTNTASSSSSDLVQVTLWDGATQIGSAVFTGAETKATSTLSTQITIAKDTDKDVTVKVDLANIGTSASGNQGSLVAVDIDTNSTNTQGVGTSGTTINASGSTDFSGVRMFSSYPTIVKQAVPSTTLVNGVMDLYRFSIKANDVGGNGIGLHQLTINLATSSGSNVSGTTTVTLADVYAYTDSAYSSPVAAFTSGKVITQLAALKSSGDNDAELSAILQIPAGATYYFRVTGTATLTAGTGTFSGSVTTRLGGDTTYPTLAARMAVRGTVDGNANGDNLVWSPNATTTSTTNHVDWTNGYFISGLPSDGSEVVTLSK